MRKVFIHLNIHLNATANHSFRYSDRVVIERVFCSHLDYGFGPLYRESLVSFLPSHELFSEQKRTGDGISLLGRVFPQVLFEAQEEHRRVEKRISKGMYLGG